ncbi:unnamed protein product [Protopolystoma xenopodis]|uniref:Uncharacterized protein n=1 Tax=Protopolystoma xenopodis TaxID=117903 RepID=A0A3S5AQF1_9PLAT|nr:unnamed protein product [Protopolystoma xenopodis]
MEWPSSLGALTRVQYRPDEGNGVGELSEIARIRLSLKRDVKQAGGRDLGKSHARVGGRRAPLHLPPVCSIRNNGSSYCASSGLQLRSLHLTRSGLSQAQSCLCFNAFSTVLGAGIAQPRIPVISPFEQQMN